MPKRIAVLGGGASSLAAVWGLTQDPDWKQKLDFTVYTLGWRLGGKGATGRDATQGNRIQEHGLHLWFGFYENAHAMLKQVMAELDRPASAPIRTWEQAMLPHNQFAMEQTFNGEWQTSAAWNGSGVAVRKTSTAGGREASFTFEGTGVALVGRYGQDGGRADLYLDGGRAGVVDAYIPERTFDNDLWHVARLRPGRHTIRLVTRDDAHPRSTGKRLTIELAIVYRTAE